MAKKHYEKPEIKVYVVRCAQMICASAEPPINSNKGKIQDMNYGWEEDI